MRLSVQKLLLNVALQDLEAVRGYVPDYMWWDRVADLLELSEQVFFVRVVVQRLYELLPLLGHDPGPHGFYWVEVRGGHWEK